MPTYDYACGGCGHQLEVFQSITARPLRKCPRCGALRLSRLIGGGAGFLFKGSGFYETDYRSEGYQKDAAAESKAGKEPAADAAKKAPAATTKPAEGGDSKAAEKPPAKAAKGGKKASKKAR